MLKTMPMFPIGGIVDENIRDYCKDPFFKQKTEESKNTLDRVGFPKEIVDQINKRPA